jgi:cobalt/nickel transport system permease protein
MADDAVDRPRRSRRGLTESVSRAMCRAFDAEDIAARDGLLQHLDPRIKVGGFVLLIVVAVSVRSLVVLGGLFGFAVLLALLSRIAPARLARQVWLGVFAFTGLVALPAIVLVPGEVVARVPGLAWPITLQGLRSAAFLLGRGETAATFAALLVLSTPWPHVLKALRAYRAPVVLVAILGMTHRYVFLLQSVAVQMVEARRSRTVGALGGRDRRRMAAATAGVLFGKALHLSSEVHLAMISRGYRGEVFLLDDFRTRPRDWVALAVFGAVAAMAMWFGGA